MADPVSVTGLVISALGVAGWVRDYISSCKDAPQHIKDLGQQAEVTARALEILRQHLQPPCARQVRLERASVLFVAAGGCHEQLRRLRKLLPSTWPAPKHKALGHVLTWSSKKGDVTDALVSLRGYVQVFHLAVDLDGLNSLSLAHHESSRYVQEKLQLLEAQGGTTSDEVEAVRLVMQYMSSQLSTSIQSLGEKIEQIDLDNKKLRLLDALEGLHFQEKHIDLQLRRTEGVGQWLLLEPTFVAWREASAEKRILWCHGLPGAGKTYLASVIIDHLQDRIVHTGGRVLYFYFDYRQQSEQTPLKTLATLLKQLIATYQGIPEGASMLFEHIVSGKDLPSWSLLVNSFIGSCAHSEEVFLVLDTMDECDEHKNRPHILDLLDLLEEQSQLRILIISRSYPSDIKEAFAEYPEIVIQASDSDIHTFLSGIR